MSIIHCETENVVTTSAMVAKIDIETLKFEDSFELPETNFELKLREKPYEGQILHGLVIYFESHFTKGRTGRLTLTNAPSGDPTHWQQCLCLFEVQIYDYYI